MQNESERMIELGRKDIIDNVLEWIAQWNISIRHVASAVQDHKTLLCGRGSMRSKDPITDCDCNITPTINGHIKRWPDFNSQAYILWHILLENAENPGIRRNEQGAVSIPRREPKGEFGIECSCQLDNGAQIRRPGQVSELFYPDVLPNRSDRFRQEYAGGPKVCDLPFQSEPENGRRDPIIRTNRYWRELLAIKKES
jgi:hypothetical protein